MSVLLDFLMVSDLFCAFVLFEIVLANYLLHVELRVNKARDDYLKAYPQGALAERSVDATSGTVRVEVDKVDVEVDGASREAAPAIGEFVAARAGRCGARLVGPDGTMRFSDQHVDMFTRWAMPPAYLIACCVIILR